MVAPWYAATPLGHSAPRKMGLAWLMRGAEIERVAAGWAVKVGGKQ